MDKDIMQKVVEIAGLRGLALFSNIVSGAFDWALHDLELLMKEQREKD